MRTIIIFAEILFFIMNSLSVTIITFNEEDKIGRCLDSVKEIADEIIVVDSLSTDKTETICKSYGVNFVSREWPGYSEQKNFADSLAKGDLILSIDADEALSEMLKESIKQIKQIPLPGNRVFSMNRLTNYCGKWIKRCGFYPDNKVRIWRNGFVQWEGLIHEKPKFESEPDKVLLKGDLLHYSYDTPESYRKQIFHFAELGGQHYYEKNKKTGLCYRMLSPTVNFIRTYFIKGGFLEGKDGLFICREVARATRHKYSTLHRFMKEKRNL